MPRNEVEKHGKTVFSAISHHVSVRAEGFVCAISKVIHSAGPESKPKCFRPPVLQCGVSVSHVQSQDRSEVLGHSIGELPDTPWIHSTFYVDLILDCGVFGNLYCYTVFFENYGTPYGVAAYS